VEHAHHFLSRLDRVSAPEVELALGLYNDVPLLKYILASSAIPEGAERVALSMADRDEGPFLVVTRDARFVTCLGRGMRVTDMPVVTRGGLDALATKGSELRRRLELARALTGGSEGRLRKLTARILTSGADLTREEFMALTPLRAIVGATWARQLVEAVTALNQAREPLMAIKKPHAQARDAMRAYWDLFWATAHLTLLACYDGIEGLAGLPEEVQLKFVEAVSWGPVRQGTSTTVLRAAWGIGRLGKIALAASKRAYREAKSRARLVNGFVRLVALGTRHSKLRSEVLKVIEAHTTMPPGSPLETDQQMLDAMRDLGPALIERPDDFSKATVETGRRAAMVLGSARPVGSPLRFERESDVPDELATYLAANDLSNFFSEATSLIGTFTALPWVSRARAEDFYLPAALQAHSPHRDPLEHVMSFLASFRAYYGVKKNVPERSNEPRVGRNDPCHCGSGKKFKRCHGA
jgi:hypothetical protein